MYVKFYIKCWKIIKQNTVEPRFNEVPGTGEIGSLNREPRYNEFVEN